MKYAFLGLSVQLISKVLSVQFSVSTGLAIVLNLSSKKVSWNIFRVGKSNQIATKNCNIQNFFPFWWGVFHVVREGVVCSLEHLSSQSDPAYWTLNGVYHSLHLNSFSLPLPPLVHFGSFSGMISVSSMDVTICSPLSEHVDTHR